MQWFYLPVPDAAVSRKLQKAFFCSVIKRCRKMLCCKVADSWKVKGAGEKKRALHGDLQLHYGPLVSFSIGLPGFFFKKRDVCCKHRKLSHCRDARKALRVGINDPLNFARDSIKDVSPWRAVLHTHLWWFFIRHAVTPGCDTFGIGNTRLSHALLTWLPPELCAVLEGCPWPCVRAGCTAYITWRVHFCLSAFSLECWC